ncbi:hypothetical protein CSC71_04840 [Pseudoxanthomonas sangjuensis]|nr:hypothetical protein CSC71_04840 [Pseudoxanthomonas sangjuensis]
MPSPPALRAFPPPAGGRGVVHFLAAAFFATFFTAFFAAFFAGAFFATVFLAAAFFAVFFAFSVAASALAPALAAARFFFAWATVFFTAFFAATVRFSTTFFALARRVCAFATVSLATFAALATASLCATASPISAALTTARSFTFPATSVSVAATPFSLAIGTSDWPMGDGRDDDAIPLRREGGKQARCVRPLACPSAFPSPANAGGAHSRPLRTCRSSPLSARRTGWRRCAARRRTRSARCP